MVKQRFSFIIAIVLVLTEIGLDQLGIKNTMISISLFSIAGVLILWAVYPLVTSIYKEINAWSEAKITLLVISACLIFIIITLNTIIYIKMRMWNPNQIVSQSLLTAKKIENQLHNWAYKSGYSIQSSNIKEAKDATRFLFILRHVKTQKKIAVLNRKEDSIYRISIQTSLIVDEEHQKLIENMSQEEKRHFISHIRLELLKYGIDYVGIKYPLQHITLLDEFVYDESLTRTAFLKNLMFVLRAKLLLHEMILEKLIDMQ